MSTWLETEANRLQRWFIFSWPGIRTIDLLHKERAC